MFNSRLFCIDKEGGLNSISIRSFVILCAVSLNLHACASQKVNTEPLSEARKSFHTELQSNQQAHADMPDPPQEIFVKVQYSSPAGPMGAYLTPDPRDGKKHPAIIWVTGGDCNTVDDGCWNEGPEENNQSASAFRKNGIVMMFPSLRGGNQNPGSKEGFLGEIDDVLAAGEFLKKQSYVDPDRVYLGGHSTGGTVALLAAECSPKFRAVFSFGPVRDIRGYGDLVSQVNLSDSKEVELRSPGYWLNSIKTPTFVIEGTEGQSNISELTSMQDSCTNKLVHFVQIEGKDHFSGLSPTTRDLANKILADTGSETNITLD